MTQETGQQVVYSDQYFKFDQSLIGIVYLPHFTNFNTISLPVSLHEKPTHRPAYMPIFNPLRLKYSIYPGILLFENQNQTTKARSVRDSIHRQRMLPIIKCIVPNESNVTLANSLCNKQSASMAYDFSVVESQVMEIVHRDIRNVMSRIPLHGKTSLQEMDRKNPVIAAFPAAADTFHKKDVSILVRDEEENNPLLPLLPDYSDKRSYEFERKGYQEVDDYRNPTESKRASLSTSSSSYSLAFSSSKNKSKGGFQMLDISDDYEMLPDSDIPEARKAGTIAKENLLAIPEERPPKHGRSAGLPANFQESFSSIEPYPLPEAPSLLLLEPLLLMQQDIEIPESKKRKRRKEQLTRSEQQKVARIMIGYTLAFFLLAIVTFYVVYFV